MSVNIEIEVKNLISESEYKMILNHFKVQPSDIFTQTNHYIDTNTQELKRLGISLRIREKNGYKLTLKTPLAEGLLEKKQTLKKEEFDTFVKTREMPFGEVLEFIDRLYIKPGDLQLLASLTTERAEVLYNGFTLAIDKNSYHGKVDYELEMNSNSLNKARASMEDFLKEVGLEFHESTISKQKRAIAQTKLNN